MISVPKPRTMRGDLRKRVSGSKFLRMYPSAGRTYLLMPGAPMHRVFIKLRAEAVSLRGDTKMTCGFTAGKCAHHSTSCCRNCAANRGWLQYIPLDELEVLDRVPTDSVQADAGFCGPAGCVIPVEHRSLVCLHYLCHAVDRAQTFQVRERREALRKAMWGFDKLLLNLYALHDPGFRAPFRGSREQFIIV